MAGRGEAKSFNTAPTWNEEAPDELKNLIQLVTNTFSGEEESVLIKLLMRQKNGEMRLEDLREFLKFDLKTMKITIENLQSQRLIKMRRSDGTQRKVDTLRMDYRVALGVILRRIDVCVKSMGKLELRNHPRDQMTFKCSGCTKSFDVLQILEIFCKRRNNPHCPFCDQLVEEFSVEINPKINMGNFNNQLEPIFNLVKMLAEQQKLSNAQHAQPTDSFVVKNGPDGQGQGGWKTGNQQPNNYKIFVNIMDEDEEEDEQMPPMKQIPPWMVEGTTFAGFQGFGGHKTGPY